MKIVLLSGGSGKRLWPLSNDSRSKQFLKVLRNSEGQLESMVQRVWGQIASAGLREHALIATSKPQVEMIYNQLGSEIEVVVEPERRDTYPAIALAATYLYSVEGVSLNETVVVMPVDPYVEESFFHKTKELSRVLNESGADLALMGVKPTYPSEKYGYIVPQSGTAHDAPYMNVQSFREKPREEEAAAMIEQAALWNCGVFAFKLDFIINILLSNGLPIQYDEMVKQYDKLPKNSFDYEVVEKANLIVALPYEGDWKDLGTWNTLTEQIATPLIGKGIITESSSNTHIINELEIPITLLNLSNVIVAASPDGILVSDKASSPMIKEVMKHSDQRPMYEERRWGRYRVLDYLKYSDGNEVLTKRICISPGQNLSYQYHLLRNEVWTVVSGNGEMILNDKRFPVKAGDVLVISKQSKHSLRAETEMDIIEVQTGSELIEEDIVRLAFDWNEIMQLCTV
ncbi:sugar phosphate nucleotidyltransferase [Paenibacillus harenae]|uniref:Mannose-1-phosphate guanylyltransferase n=1 Tax=Paenibacillus harenae TaxID=306543 RepID=A0ABT9U8V5_PAEHA|nr:sugar phosphate nucleotidyltransferase [Paenibacillus harenae]MDQ0062630.1 mannose-1-phosphate guanylyltransferase [Paenibacillus harenae]MDQ0116087.1 mannose-1-phosphate guanylyltransferase [Paenibacillus harenae]